MLSQEGLKELRIGVGSAITPGCTLLVLILETSIGVDEKQGESLPWNGAHNSIKTEPPLRGLLRPCFWQRGMRDNACEEFRTCGQDDNQQPGLTNGDNASGDIKGDISIRVPGRIGGCANPKLAAKGSPDQQVHINTCSRLGCTWDQGPCVFLEGQ